MSQAEELLSQLAVNPSEHFHAVVDDDSYFVIDPNTKKIENKSGRINYIMQKDHKAEIYTIELPRIVEGHDMTLCNRVYAHFLNVDSETQEERYDLAELTDLRVPSDNPDIVLCTWIVERHATQLVGSLAFLIQYECVAEDGTVDYEFHSDWYSDIIVKKGRPDADPVILEYTNLLEQWYQRIFGTGDGLLDGIEAARVAAIENINATAATRTTEAEASIEAKGLATLDTIPPDYTALYNMVEEALRTKADVIALEAAGTPIVVDDASDDHLLGLKVFGETEQVTTTGKNLLDVDEHISFTYIHGKEIFIPAGTYILSFTSETHTGTYPPYVCFKDNNVGTLVSGSGKQYPITLPADETQLYIYANNYSASGSEGISATIDQLMLSVDGGIYEPYTGGKASPSPEYPQTLESVDNPEVDICGKNVIPYPYCQFPAGNGEETRTGVTIKYADGVITLNGTATQDMGIALIKNGAIPVDGEYTLSGCPDGADATYYMQPYIDGKYQKTCLNAPMTYNWKGKLTQLSMYIKSGVTLNNVVLRPQLERGSVATDYEPYKPVQTLATQRTLNGISDIKDELVYDFQTNTWQLIQRIGEAVFNGTDPWGYSSGGKTRFVLHLNAAGFPSGFEDEKSANCLCSHYVAAPHGTVYQTEYTAGINGEYLWVCNPDYADVDSWKAHLSAQNAAGTPLTVKYILAEPIITELTTEEILAFKALRTNKTNTVIQNGVGADMEVTYAADTKTFIVNTLRSVVREILAEQ